MIVIQFSMEREQLMKSFSPLVNVLLKIPIRCCKWCLFRWLFFIIQHDIQSHSNVTSKWCPNFYHFGKWELGDWLLQVNWKVFMFFLSRAATNSMADLVSHLTIYFKQIIYWQPRYMSGIWIVTSSACASQKNQALFQMHIRSLSSMRLFTLKQLYQCCPPDAHLQVFLVFCFTWSILKIE